MKLPALLSALALSLTLVACGGRENKDAPADKPAEPATKPIEPAPNPTTQPADPTAKPDDPNAKPAEPTATGELPVECAEYKAAIERLATCDKLPKESRDAMKSAFDTASASWSSLTGDAKAAAATACKAATDATKQASSACGQ